MYVVKVPLVPLAGVRGAGVDAPAGAEHKMIVLEADAARDTGAGIRASVTSANRHEMISAATGKT